MKKKDSSRIELRMFDEPNAKGFLFPMKCFPHG